MEFVFADRVQIIYEKEGHFLVQIARNGKCGYVNKKILVTFNIFLEALKMFHPLITFLSFSFHLQILFINFEKILKNIKIIDRFVLTERILRLNNEKSSLQNLQENPFRC